MTKSNVIWWIKYISLKSIGLYENTKLSVIYTLSYLSLFSIGIFGSVVGFLNATKGKERLESLASITVQLFGMLIFLQIIRRRSNILDLFSDLDKDEFFTENASNKINRFLVNRLIWLFAWTLLLSILFNIPAVYFLFQDDLTNTKEILVIPFWFSCSAENPSTNIMNRICLKINTKGELIMANAFQMTIMLWITLTHLIPFTLFSITVAHLIKHFESIKMELHKFNKIAKGELAALKKKSGNINDNSEQSAQTDEFLIQSFLNIFKHQQFLQTRSLQMVEAWKGFVTWYSTSCNMNSILTLFILRAEISGSTSIAFKSLVVLLFLLLVAFIISYSSQSISNLNEFIFQELYNIQWYDFSLKFRKIFLTTLILNQTSVKLKIAEIVELNLNTYGKMVKTKYSILNALLLKYGK